MATTFKNARAVLANTATDVYTVPASTTAIVIGCQVANVGASANTLDFWWTDASDTDSVTMLGDAISIAVAAAYEPVGGKLVLEAGDKLRGLSSTDTELEVSVSVVELS
jgi:hypothetical protein